MSSTQITNQPNSHEREPVATSPEVRALKNLRLAETDRARANLFAVPVKPLKQFAKKLEAAMAITAKPKAAEQAPVAPVMDIEAIRRQVAEAETAAVNDLPRERAPETAVSNVVALPSHRALTDMEAQARAAIEQAINEAA